MAGGHERRLARIERTFCRLSAEGASQVRDIPFDDPARIGRIVGILSGAEPEDGPAPEPTTDPAVRERERRIIEALAEDEGYARA